MKIASFVKKKKNGPHNSIFDIRKKQLNQKV